MLRFKITGQRVLIRPDEVEKKTASGLLLPGTWNEQAERNATQSGVVVQLGAIAYKDISDGTPWCKEGDHVVFARHSGKFIENPDDQKDILVMVRDEDIQGIIPKPQAAKDKEVI